MAIEVEARFRADDQQPLGALSTAPRLGHAILGEARTAEVSDRYLDTDDARLARERWACRLRERDGSVRVSLKGPPGDASGEAWHHRRPEIEGPATASLDPGDWPLSAARSRVAAMARGGRLHERLRVHQERTERPVTIDGSTALGVLSLDRVRLSGDGRDLGELFIVELELREATPAAEASLEAMAAALGAIPGLVPEPRTKLELALARLDGAR
jgi:inorganic triphosphatase YgiF